MVTNGSGRLTSVREVQIGQTTYNPTNNNGTLTVVARLASQRLAAGGTTGTSFGTGETLWLTNWIVLANGSVLSGASSNNTVTNGIVSFTITNLGGVHGVCRLAAWKDVGTVNGVLDPDRDAWATHSYALGTTVEATASPDVGDDKNTEMTKRARIRVTRTGPTNSSLVVNLTIQSNVVYRPTDLSDLAPKYGTSGTADYSISSGTGTWSTSSPYTTGTLTIPAGLATADAQVITRADNITEQNLIVCRLGASTNYAPGISTNVSILIYDGPLWSLQELGVSGFTTNSSAVYAINEITDSTQPRVAGYSSHTQTNYFPTGGYWTLPDALFYPQENVVYAGISTDPLVLVGPSGNDARVTRVSGSDFNLLHIFIGPSAAYGIVSNTSVIVGHSKNHPAGYLRPVAWEGFGTNYTTKDVGGSLDVNWAGSAFGANLSNQVVGQFHVDYSGGSSIDAAFRSKAGTNVQQLAFNSANGVGDILYAPGKSGNQNLKARARLVNRTGQAVGWYDNPSSFRRGVAWPSSSLASDSAAVDLQAWKAKVGSQIDSHSEAKGINEVGWIVGWSGDSITDPTRAVIKWAASTNATDWIDLNDAHFVSGTSGWVLKEATAVNDAGHIVGNGALNGSARAFILVPRAIGN